MPQSKSEADLLMACSLRLTRTMDEGLACLLYSGRDQAL